MKKPDFLIIGAGRSGTTWLYENMKKFKTIWLPPIKEIHYFDRNIFYPSPSFLNESIFLKRLLGNESYNKAFRKKMIRNIGKSVINFDLNSVLWKIKYFTGKINDEWYTSLFNTTEEKITGDITPAYQLLEKEDVSHISQINPDAKIIFIIRNPIDRTWSQLRKNLQIEYGFDEIKNIISSPDVTLRNDYLRTINIWKKYFPSSNFKLIFFDDIINQPNELLNDIFLFITENKNKSTYKIERTDSKINIAPWSEMSEKMEKILTIELMPLLEDLANNIDGYPAKWLHNAKERLYHLS